MNTYQRDIIIHMKDTPTVNCFQRAVIDCEESVIKAVIKEWLKRDIELEDYKKITRVFTCNDWDKYTLVYDMIPLGYVRYEFSFERVSVRFVPFRF
jgi:hypothetical protein